MPVTVVVGAQFGSEGKGKVAHWLSRELGAAAAVRVGGPNSGHTVMSSEREALIFRQLPTAAILPEVICVIAPGSYIDLDVLLGEIAIANLDPSRLWIDARSMLISQEDRIGEAALNDAIGSTGTGSGAALIRRLKRIEVVTFADKVAELRPFIRETGTLLRGLLVSNRRIVIEGTQGFGLSVLHSPHFPFVTTRDTSAAAFVSESGLSPRDVDDIVLVMRTYPIRVAGNSGPLAHETTWQAVTAASHSEFLLSETTSVTKRIRRVGRFDADIVRAAISCNLPHRLVLNHLDYVGTSSGSGAEQRMRFVRHVEEQLGQAIDLVGLGRDALIPRAHLHDSAAHTSSS